MPEGTAPSPVSRRDRGFALLIVLWTLVLIAFIVTHVTTAGRTEVQIADNLATNAAAQAAADGAVYQAIFNQLDPQADRRWALDGKAHELRIGASRIAVRVDDEAGLINPNLASAGLMAGLYRAVGVDPETAAELAGRVAEWMGATAKRPAEQQLAEYRAAGLDYGPPRSPFESVDELGRVRGMNARLLAALRPHLSLFGLAEPRAAAADPVVASAIALAGHAALPSATGAVPPAPVPVPAAAAQPEIVRIQAVALGPGNARASRTAIVRIGDSAGLGYTLRSWGAGTD